MSWWIDELAYVISQTLPEEALKNSRFGSVWAEVPTEDRGVQLVDDELGQVNVSIQESIIVSSLEKFALPFWEKSMIRGVWCDLATDEAFEPLQIFVLVLVEQFFRRVQFTIGLFRIGRNYCYANDCVWCDRDLIWLLLLMNESIQANGVTVGLYLLLFA